MAIDSFGFDFFLFWGAEGPENHEKSGNRPFSNRETHFRNLSADQAILKFYDFLDFDVKYRSSLAMMTMIMNDA